MLRDPGAKRSERGAGGVELVHQARHIQFCGGAAALAQLHQIDQLPFDVDIALRQLEALLRVPKLHVGLGDLGCQAHLLN